MLMNPAALRMVASLAVLLGLVATQPSGAEESDPEVELDAARSELDAAEAELALLRASDADLEAQLASLEERITEGEQALSDATAAVEDAELRVAQATGAVEIAQSIVESQKTMVQERAVAAFVGGGSVTGLTALIESDDYNEMQRRLVFAGQVAEHDSDLLADYRAATAELERQQGAAATAEVEAQELRAAADVRLAELEADQAAQAMTAQVLDVRISGMQGEVDALAAQEADLVTLLLARQQGTGERPPASSVPDSTSPSTPPTTSPSSLATTTIPPSSVPGSTQPSSTSLVTLPSTTIAPTTSPPTTIPSSTIPGAPSFSWPASGPVTSVFGWRWGRMHNGIDIGAPTGDPVVASTGGTVILAEWFGGYGNAVIVDHGNGFTTINGHLSVISVEQGETVSSGQRLGAIGSTGHSTGPHLHFEIRWWAEPQDPLLYLP